MATIDELNLTPYQRIMARMTPFVNPYMGAGQVMGGYDPSFQGGYDPGLYSRLTRSGLINTGGMGGGGGGGGDYTPTPSPFDNMTDAEKAAYYAANPTMATITQLGQKAFGLTSLGALQRAMFPDFVNNQGLIAMGVNPAAYQAAKESFRASEIGAMNAGYPSAIEAAQSYGGASMAEQQAMNDAINATAAAAYQAAADQAAQSYGGASMAEQQAMNDALGEAAVGSYGGASMAEQQAMNDALGAPGQSVSDSAASDAGGYGSGDSAGFGGGTDSGSDGWAMGGKVTKSRLTGPAPNGPDEGYGALLSGEYVIKKSAVKKYGQGLLDMINDGKIPAKKMKSLLG